MPRVSIAIRAFRRRWLVEAILSVLRQDDRDLELVIYDDAGNLESLARLFRDPRVRYHRAAGPLSPSGRFAAAVALCRGDYVGLLDDDDAYAPGFTAALAAALDAEPRAGVAFCRTTWLGRRGHRAPVDARPVGLVDDAAGRMLRDGWSVTPSHLLFRRAAYEAAFAAAPMPADVSPDVVLNLRLAGHGWSHVLLDALLVVTRWHHEQLSRASMAALDREVRTWRALDFDDPRLVALRERRLARSLLARAAFALRVGDREQARADLQAAATASPEQWRGRRAALQAAAACGWPGAAMVGVVGAVRDWRCHDPPRRVGDG